MILPALANPAKSKPKQANWFGLLFNGSSGNWHAEVGEGKEELHTSSRIFCGTCKMPLGTIFLLKVHASRQRNVITICWNKRHPSFLFMYQNYVLGQKILPLWWKYVSITSEQESDFNKGKIKFTISLWCNLECLGLIATEMI